MKLLKKIVLTVIATFMVLSIAFGILIQKLDSATIKDYLSAQLTKITGEKSEIKGNLTWKIYPHPAIELSQIRIGHQTNNPKMLLNIEKTTLNLKLAPLFKGKVAFKNIGIKGLEAHLNIEKFTRSMGKIQQLKSINYSSSNQSTSSLPFTFAINQFSLNNANIFIQNKDNNINLESLSVDVSGLELNSHQFPVRISAHLTGAIEKHQVNTTMMYQGTMQLKDKFTFNVDSPFKNIQTEGDLILNKTQIDNFKVSSLNAHIIARGSEIFLNPLSLSLYEGKSAGMLKYQFKKKKLSFTQTANMLNSSLITQDILNKSLLEGALDASINIHTNFKDNNWRQAIRSNGGLTIKNGQLTFIDLDKMLLDFSQKIENITKLKLDMAPQLSSFDAKKYHSGSTAFKLLNIKYDLDQPLIARESILLQSKKLELEGHGQLNINTLELNNKLNVKIFSSSESFSKINKLFKGGIPLQMTGSLSRPYVYPNINEISPILARYYLEQSIEKPVNKLKNKLQELFIR